MNSINFSKKKSPIILWFYLSYIQFFFHFVFIHSSWIIYVACLFLGLFEQNCKIMHSYGFIKSLLSVFWNNIYKLDYWKKVWVWVSNVHAWNKRNNYFHIITLKRRTWSHIKENIFHKDSLLVWNDVIPGCLFIPPPGWFWA